MPSPLVLASGRDDWQTPADLVDLVVEFNDGNRIGIDPCSAPGNPTCADVFVHPPDDGLAMDWRSLGLVYVNPPFKTISAWAAKAAEEADRGVEIIFLCSPRTDTLWFRNVWTSRAIAFWHGNKADRKSPLYGNRIPFVHPDTGLPAAQNTAISCLAYWGPRSMHFARIFAPYAHIVFP